MDINYRILLICFKKKETCILQTWSGFRVFRLHLCFFLLCQIRVVLYCVFEKLHHLGSTSKGFIGKRQLLGSWTLLRHQPLLGGTALNLACCLKFSQNEHLRESASNTQEQVASWRTLHFAHKFSQDEHRIQTHILQQKAISMKGVRNSCFA